MTNFNLLSWRMDLKYRRIASLINSLTSLLLFSFVILFLGHVKLSKQVHQMQHKNYVIEKGIKILTPRYHKQQTLMKKENILRQKMRTLNALQKKQLIPLRLFTEMYKNTSDTVILNLLKFNDDNVQLAGVVLYPHDITNLSGNLEKDAFASQVKVTEIKTHLNDDTNAHPMLDFILVAKLNNI